MAHLPLGESLVADQIIRNPPTHQLDGLRVEERIAQRRHPSGTERRKARQRHRLRERTWLDDAIGRVAAIRHQQAVNQSQCGQRAENPRIEVANA